MFQNACLHACTPWPRQYLHPAHAASAETSVKHTYIYIYITNARLYHSCAVNFGLICIRLHEYVSEISVAPQKGPSIFSDVCRQDKTLVRH